MRVATGTIETPASGDSFNSLAYHSSASSDPLIITSGASDAYMYLQLYANSDSSDLKSVKANIGTLMVYKMDLDERFEAIDSEINDLNAKIGLEDIQIGTENKGYYSGNAGVTIAYTANSSSSAYTVDLTDYIGKTVLLNLISTATGSTRVSALCDSSGKISRKYVEQDFANGLYPNGVKIQPTATDYMLYISFTTIGGSIKVQYLTGLFEQVSNMEEHIYPDTVYVDGSVNASGSGTAESPYKTITEGINSGAETVLVKAGEYDALYIRNRMRKLNIMLWEMPGTYSTSQADVPKIKITESTNYGVRIENVAEIYLSDIWSDGQNKHLFLLNDVKKAEFVRCYASNNVDSDSCGFRCLNSNVLFVGCKAWNITLDGFNLHKYGNYDLIDCIAYDCGDDGVSHHDGCTGMISGGEYYRCGKGGVASPCYGSTVNISNVHSHDNIQFGILARSNDQYNHSHGKIINCVIINNGDKDIEIQSSDIVGWNNIYDTKDVDINSTFVENISNDFVELNDQVADLKTQIDDISGPGVNLYADGDVNKDNLYFRLN